MYYQTTLREVGIGSAIDVQGKRLMFLGNFPAQVGDVVVTDGQVIFGHASVENTPIIPAIQSGIPIEGYGEFRGYIDQDGIFKNYHVALADWIVNNDKIFKHGLQNEETKVIDAEISDSGDLYVVTKGFYRKSQYVDYYRSLFTHRMRGPQEAFEAAQAALDYGQHPYFLTNKFTVYKGRKLRLGVDTNWSYGGDEGYPSRAQDKNYDIKIYKNGSLLSNFNLKPIADIVINKCWEVRDKTMEKSSNDGVILTQFPPPADFIASVYANVISFHIDKNGDWDALIGASAYGYCFPYLSFDMTVFGGTFPNNEDKIFNENLRYCIEQSFEVEFFRDSNFLEIEKYPAFTGTKKVDGEYTAAFKQYILDKCAYYIPLARYKHRVWYPSIFNASVLVKVHNGQIVDTVQSYCGSGYEKIYMECVTSNEKQGEAMLDTSYYNATIDQRYYNAISIPAEEMRKEWTFPLGDGYYYRANGIKVEEIFNSKNEKVATIPDDIDLYDDYAELYARFPMTSNFLTQVHHFYDYTAETLAEQLGLESKNILRSNIFLYEGMLPNDPLYGGDPYPIDYDVILANGTRRIESTYPDYFNQQCHFFNGWFPYDVSSLEDPDFVTFKHCFTELKNGDCLFGLYGKQLYKISRDGKVEKMLDQYEDLKNFRLRELKNITKSKK